MLYQKVARSIVGFLYLRMFLLYWPLYRIYKRWTDRTERAWVRSLVAQGDVIVDVGANIGVYSIFFASLVGSKGQVLAFEPDPRNFNRLQRATARHAQILAIESAASDVNGSARLFLSEGLNFDHKMYGNPGSEYSVEVPTIRLDDFESLRDRSVGLIKIDVQGFECCVLPGARATLSRNRDVSVLIEYFPWGLRSSGSSPEAFVDLIRECGFVVTTFDKDPNVLFTGFDKVCNRNWYRNLILSRDSNASLRSLTRASFNST